MQSRTHAMTGKYVHRAATAAMLVVVAQATLVHTHTHTYIHYFNSQNASLFSSRIVRGMPFLHPFPYPIRFSCHSTELNRRILLLWSFVLIVIVVVVCDARHARVPIFQFHFIFDNERHFRDYISHWFHRLLDSTKTVDVAVVVVVVIVLVCLTTHAARISQSFIFWFLFSKENGKYLF